MNPNEIPTTITRLVYDAPRIPTPDGNTLKLSQNQAAQMLAHFWPEIERHIRGLLADEIYTERERFGQMTDAEINSNITMQCVGLMTAYQIVKGLEGADE